VTRGGVADLGLAALCFQLLALSLACSPGSRRCEPVVSECAEALPASVALPVPSVERGSVSLGRVYLDLSASMQGFVSDDSVEMPFTLYQKALDQVLPEAFGSIPVESLEVHGFGGEIVRDIGQIQSYVVQRSAGSSPRRRYDKGATDLVRVIADAALAPEVVSVVITDGVQDRRLMGGAAASGPGFVRTAVVQEMRRSLVGEGFGIWLVGVMSRFDGCYYNVKPNAANQVGRCMEMEGVRPVFFWVFSRDIQAGRRWTAYLVEELHREASAGGGEAGEAVEAVELWPGRHPRLTVAQDQKAPDELLRESSIRRVVGWKERLPEAPLSFCCPRFRGREGSRLILPMQLMLAGADSQGGAFAPLPPDVWQLVEPEEEAWTLEEREGWRGTKGGSPSLPLSLTIPYETAARKVAADEILEVPLRLRLDARRGLRGHWVERWSTGDDSTEEGARGKALYLHDVVAGLVSASLGQLEPGICLQMRLQRE